MQENVTYSTSGRWKKALAALFAVLFACALGGLATQTAWADDTPNVGGTPQLTVQDEALDLSEGNIKFFDGETYTVGDGLYAPNPKGDYAVLKAGADFGVKVVAPNGTEADATEQIAAVSPKANSAFVLDQLGSYNLTLYAISDKCKGQLEGTVTVVDAYFKVYLQEVDAEPVEVKAFKKEADFSALSVENASPVSAIYGSKVSSTNNYVTLEALLEAAGIADKWKSGASVEYFDGSESYTYDQIAQAKFYPKASAEGLDKSNAVPAPFVFALTEASSSIMTTAADAEQANLEAANKANAPRVLFGYIDDGAASNAGHRLWSNAKSITVVAADERLDLSEGNIKFFDGETYTVGDGLYAPNPKGDYAALKAGADFGVKVVAPDGTEADATEQIAAVSPKANSAFVMNQLGEYKLTLYAISDKCKGQLEGTVTVVDAYFKVYLQKKGSDSEEVKSYKKSTDFSALVSNGAPVSGLFFKGGVWNVSTAASYVKLDDLLSDAGLASLWGAGASISYGNSTFTFEEISAANKFYPSAQAAGTSTAKAAVEAPFVFALKEFSNPTTDESDAEAIQTANVAAANDSTAPRVVFGVTEDEYTSKSAAGKRLWSNVASITIVVDEEAMAIADANAVAELIAAAKANPTEANVAAAQDALAALSDEAKAKLPATAADDIAIADATVKVAAAKANPTEENVAAAKDAVAALSEAAKESLGADAVKSLEADLADAEKAAEAAKPAAQTITTSVKATVSKTFGAKAFSLGAKANTELSYKSDKAKVATVDKDGRVTIKGAGSAKITITAAATASYEKATKTITVKVEKAKNTLAVKAKSPAVKAKSLKKKAQTIAMKKAFTVTKGKAKSTVTFKKASGNKKITVAKNGKITVKKGMKKGTYKVKVKVTAAANANYKAATKTVTVKVKVK